MKNKKEIWKSFENFRVSNLGNVVRPNGKKAKLTGRAYLNHSKNGDSAYTPLHIIVATLFVPNPKNLKIVKYKDGNKENKQANNLEWTKNYSKWFKEKADKKISYEEKKESDTAQYKHNSKKTFFGVLRDKGCYNSNEKEQINMLNKNVKPITVEESLSSIRQLLNKTKQTNKWKN